MKAHGIAALVSALAVLAVPTIAHAIINTGDSIDWLCECKRHIAIVRVPFPTGREVLKGDRGYSNVTGRVVSVLKGKPPTNVVIDCWNGVRVAPGKTHDVLAFFNDSLRVEYAIAFDDSQSCVYSLAFTRDCRVLRSRRAILAAVTERLRRMSREGRGAPGTSEERADRARYLTLEVPEESGAYYQLFSGSMVLINVPADSEYKSRWLRDIKSTDVRRRAAAAGLLSQYSGPEITRILTELLQDSGVDSLIHFGSAKQRRVETFPAVACPACRSLRELGVAAECSGPCPDSHFSFTLPEPPNSRLRARVVEEARATRKPPSSRGKGAHPHGDDVLVSSPNKRL